MPGSVCKACGLFAPMKAMDLCGNCILLTPKQLAETRQAANLREQISTKKSVDQTAFISELQREIAQLRADKEALEEKVGTLEGIVEARS